MRQISRLLGITLLALSLSCKDEVLFVVPVAVVEVQGPEDVLVGSNITLVAVPKDEYGNRLTQRSVSWSTSDGSVATVNSGTVTGILGGQATISASVEGRTGGLTIQVNNPVPVVSSTEPELPIAGGGDFQLTVNGSGFVPTSEILWNGEARPTTYNGFSQLVAAISSADIAEAGEASITVFNPPPGGGASANQPLTVGHPVPVVASLSRDGVQMGSAEITLTVNGSRFAPESTVQWNGEALPTTHVSDTELNALLSPDNLGKPGWMEITVHNPSPGGGTSEPLIFAVRIPVEGPFLVAGLEHSCALTRAGRAHCWGENEDAQLGDGTRTDRLVPDAVVGNLEFVALSSSYAHTCGLDEVGTPYCWGSGGWLKLGSPTSVTQEEPGPVVGDFNFVSIATGWDHSCGVAFDGQAYCWGRNDFGQLGGGAGLSEEPPVPVNQSGLTFRSIAANQHQTCAVTTDGRLFCWGLNDTGQLGDGTTENRVTPVQVALPGAVAESTVGYGHACARMDDGRGFCWGQGGAGELGNGIFGDSWTPVEVVWTGGWAGLSAGGAFTCGIVHSGQVFCWGDPWGGRLGNGDWRIPYADPMVVPDLPEAFQVATGNNHACVLTVDGRAYCWGTKDAGKLGNGTTNYRLSPTRVAGALPPFRQVEVGGTSACGSTTTGTAYCWGLGGLGQMGNGTWDDVANPTPVEFPGTLVEVTSGLYHHCGLDGDGGAHCWGDNAEGELGNGMSGIGPIPFPVSGGHTFQQIRAGWRHTCGLAGDGRALCWGNNQYGQVGLGYSGDPETVPAEVIMPPGVTFSFVDLGYWHTCALSTEGEAWCWGRNNNGQLGDGTNSRRDLPAKVEGLPALSEITVGGWHTCALDTSGEAYCWGRGTLGRLGTGSGDTFNTPQVVQGGHTFRNIVGTAARTCGITTDDRALCWGHNVRGTLGIGRDETPILEPAEVAGSLSFESFAAGFSDWHACGVTTGGAAYCWGQQRLSELGIGILGIEPRPVQVSGGLQFWRPEGIGMVR